MRPIKFEGHNVIFAKDQPEYRSLPAHSKDGVVTCCWELTFWERLKSLLGGRWYLQIHTFGEPLQPLLPSVENPIKNDRNDT